MTYSKYVNPVVGFDAMDYVRGPDLERYFFVNAENTSRRMTATEIAFRNAELYQRCEDLKYSWRQSRGYIYVAWAFTAYGIVMKQALGE